MKAIVVRVPGAIVGKARARVTRNGTFTPARTLHWEAVVKAHAIEQAGMPRLTGPLALELNVGMPVPPSWPKRRRAEALAGHTAPTSKPDASNLLKLVEDALNGILWVDDSQLVTVTVTKRYAVDPAAILTLRRAAI